MLMLEVIHFIIYFFNSDVGKPFFSYCRANPLQDTIRTLLVPVVDTRAPM